MILTGENRISQRKPCSTVTLTTTKLTWIRLGSKSDLRCERLTTVPPEPQQARLLKTEINLTYVRVETELVPLSKHTPSRL
jgi:hypothetical protein